MSESDWEDVSDSGNVSDWEDIGPEVQAMPAAAAVNAPTWGQAATFAGRSMAEGVGGMADTILSAMPGSPQFLPTRMLSDPKIPQNTVTDLMHQLFGRPEDSGVAPTAVARYGKAAIKSTVAPGGPIINALSGMAAQGAEEAFPDSAAAPFLASLATGGVANTVKGASKGLVSAGKSFERSSIGARVSDYIKSLRTKGKIEDDEVGDIGTRLSQAINEIGDTKGFGFLRDPQRLSQRNTEVLNELGPKIGSVVEAADKAGTAATSNLFDPKGAVQQLIGKSTAAKADIKEAFDEFLVKFTDPVDGWDNTIAGLNKWKTDVGDMAFSGSAKGTLPANVARKLLRAIRTDLSRGVEDSVERSGVIDPNDWKSLMRTYSNHKEIEPVLDASVTRGLSGTWDKAARTILRTSGGALTTPTLIGTALAAGAGGAPIGLAAGAILGAVGTPTGRGITGNVLKTLGRTGAKAAKGGNAAMIAPILTEPDRAERLMKGLFSPTAAAAMKKTSPIEGAFAMEKAPVVDVQQEEDSKEAAIKQIKADPYYDALAMTESSWNPKAKNPDSSAKGLFQFINSTAKSMGLDDPYDVPKSFAKVQELTDRNKSIFGDDPLLLYAGHYLGETVLRKYLNNKPLTATQQAQVDYFFGESPKSPANRFKRNYEASLAKKDPGVLKV